MSLHVKLHNKIALVTGATRGLGEAILMALAEAGAVVIGTATSEAGVDKINQLIQSHGWHGIGIMMNVADPQSISAAFDAINSNPGMPAILVNNAGITRDNLLLRMKDAEWDDVLATNLSGIFRVSKRCLRAMIKAHWGRIINIGSVVGSFGNPGQCNYAAAKAGLAGFSRSLAAEVGSRKITVNVVAPGYFETDMTKALAEDQAKILLQKIPLQRLGTPKEVADLVTFLVSDFASYITGQTIHINGGMFMD